MLIPGKEQLQKKIWWSTANHNWNGICNGGIIMAALSMYEEDPKEMSEIIALAINALPKYIKSFDETFKYLQTKIDNNEIKEIHVSIFKFYLYNKMTVIQISNATGMRRTLIEYSINKISNLLKEDETMEVA